MPVNTMSYQPVSVRVEALLRRERAECTCEDHGAGQQRARGHAPSARRARPIRRPARLFGSVVMGSAIGRGDSKAAHTRQCCALCGAFLSQTVPTLRDMR